MRIVPSDHEPTLTVTVCRDERVAVVALRGRLDVDTVEVVRSAVDGLLEDGVRELLIDMRETAYLADAAAESLVDAARWTRALGGTLHVFHVNGQPRERLHALALQIAGPLLSQAA
jgi:anti-anti-sigma factor